MKRILLKILSKDKKRWKVLVSFTREISFKSPQFFLLSRQTIWLWNLRRERCLSMKNYKVKLRFLRILFLSYHASFTQWLTIPLGFFFSVLQPLRADDCRNFQILISLDRLRNAVKATAKEFSTYGSLLHHFVIGTLGEQFLIFPQDWFSCWFHSKFCLSRFRLAVIFPR